MNNKVLKLSIYSFCLLGSLFALSGNNANSANSLQQPNVGNKNQSNEKPLIDFGVIDLLNTPVIKYDLPYLDDQKEMPILGYLGVQGSAINGYDTISYLTKSNVRAYREAGFNILSALYEREPLFPIEVRKALRICDELEMNYFVSDTEFAYSYDSQPDLETLPSVNQVMESMQSKYYFDNPSFAGLVARDEPSLYCMDGMAIGNESLIRSTDAKKIYYSTLYPSGASYEQIGLDASNKKAVSWDKYVEYATTYVEKVKPTVLAYDAYYLHRKDATIEGLNAGGEPGNYLGQLSLYRDLAMKSNIPFWVTIASYNHVYRTNDVPLKNNEWVVNTSLAYGAKGVQYYTYWNIDVADANSTDRWNNQIEFGLVSMNGALHDNYYKIQRINQNIKAVDEVLLKSTHKGVMQFGEQKLNLIEKDTLNRYGKLKNIHGDAFVGCFDNNGKDVYYIVNNSITEGIRTFKIDFNGKVNVRMTNYHGVTSKENVSCVGINLSGGEAMLLEVL